MDAASPPPPMVADLVLIGGGHAHVHVLYMLGMEHHHRQWAVQNGIRITLIAKDILTPYSGMLPGYVAGHYSQDDILIDLAKLCRFAAVRLIHAAANQITYNRNGGSGAGSGGMVHCSDGRPPIRYDCLSINIGSCPAAGDSVAQMNEVVTPVKPIANFCDYFENLLAKQQQARRRQSSVYHQRQAAFSSLIASMIREDRSLKQDEEPSSSSSSAPKEEEKKKSPPYRIGVVGAGAGGVELALAIQYRMMHHQTQQPHTADNDANNNNDDDVQVVLITKGNTILPGHNRRVRSIFERILRERNIPIYLDALVTGVEYVKDDHNDASSLSSSPSKRRSSPASAAAHSKRRLVLSPVSAKAHRDSPIADLDDVVWCVTAGVPGWLSAQTPFCTTQDGFLRVHDTYELIHHPGVFAAGDCCHMDPHPRPKAGVFAVRAGPYLLENLINYLCHRPLISHHPQQEFVGLISTGDRYAVASKGWWFCMEGRWAWRWKDWIDQRFMKRFNELPDLHDMMDRNKMKAPPTNHHRNSTNLFIQRNKGIDVMQAFAANPMRCGGCGAKVGSGTLSRVLKALYQRQVVRARQLGYDPPEPVDHDDAAIVPLPARNTGGSAAATIQTIDYFREMISDPFLFGKIAAIHALSDVHAMGATPLTALALAVVPFAADEQVTESTLLQMLSGVSDVLQDEGVRLVGGHTCEGLELACGLSVQGYTETPERLIRKRGGRVGDKLVLTKPIGTGALFAADMRAQCRGELRAEALDVLLSATNGPASRVASHFDGVHACTDVTGFGLMGHLLEMLLSNDDERGDDSNLPCIGAVLRIQDIPFLRGALEASSKGIFSTLQPQNARNRRAVVNHSEAAGAFPVEYPLLFDPQTAGGLLFFVDAEDWDEFILLLQAEKVSAHVIGELEAFSSSPTKTTTSTSMVDHEAGDVCTNIGTPDATGQRIRIEW